MRVLEPNNSQYPQTYLAELRHAVLYVFKKYLNKPYSIETDSLGIDYRSNAWSLSIEKNGESVVLPRPNHNILNTLRITSYVPFVVEYFKLYGASKKQFAFIQPEDIKKIQLAMLFNVVGRKNEASWQQSPKLYEKFRKTSGLAFEKYCKKYTLFSAEEIVKYKQHIVQRGHPKYNDAIDVIMNACHNLDLLRCYSHKQFQKAFFDYMYAHSKKKSNLLKQKMLANLVYRAQKTIQDSGEGLLCGYIPNALGGLLPIPINELPKKNLKKFYKYSIDPISFVSRFLLESKDISIKAGSLDLCDDHLLKLFQEGQGEVLNAFMVENTPPLLEQGPLNKSVATRRFEIILKAILTNPDDFLFEIDKNNHLMAHWSDEIYDITSLAKDANWGHLSFEVDYCNIFANILEKYQTNKNFLSPAFKNEKFDPMLFPCFGLRQALNSAMDQYRLDPSLMEADGLCLSKLKDTLAEWAEKIYAISLKQNKIIKEENAHLKVKNTRYTRFKQFNKELKLEINALLDLYPKAENKVQCILDELTNIRRHFVKLTLKDHNNNQGVKFEDRFNLVIKKLLTLIPTEQEALKRINNLFENFSIYRYNYLRSKYFANQQRHKRLAIDRVIAGLQADFLAEIEKSELPISTESAIEYFVGVMNEMESEYQNVELSSFQKNLEYNVLKLTIKIWHQWLENNLRQEIPIMVMDMAIEFGEKYLVSPAEKMAINLYTQDKGYRPMNLILRGFFDKALSFCASDVFSSESQIYIRYWLIATAMCASGLNKAPCEQHPFSYRVEFQPPSFVLEGRRESITNQVPILHKAFTSSSSKRPCDRLGNINILFTNCYMVNIEPLSYFTAKGEFAERELLTPPNTQFLYDACIDKNGTAYYRASIVNTPGPALNP